MNEFTIDDLEECIHVHFQLSTFNLKLRELVLSFIPSNGRNHASLTSSFFVYGIIYNYVRSLHVVKS